eukprot:538956-Rhodomonas_salina.1
MHTRVPVPVPPDTHPGTGYPGGTRVPPDTHPGTGYPGTQVFTGYPVLINNNMNSCSLMVLALQPLQVQTSVSDGKSNRTLSVSLHQRTGYNSAPEARQP